MIRIGMGYRVNDRRVRVDGSILRVDDPYIFKNLIADAAVITFATPVGFSGAFIEDTPSYDQLSLPGTRPDYA